MLLAKEMITIKFIRFYKDLFFKKSMKKVIKIIWLIIIIVAPIILWIMPATYFDTGTTICPSVLLFNLECIGCGMTRAVMHLHHLDFSEALFYNYGVLIMYPFLVFMWFKWWNVGLRYFKIAPQMKYFHKNSI